MFKLTDFWNGTILEEENFSCEYLVLEDKLITSLVSFFYSSDPNWWFCLSSFFTHDFLQSLKKRALCIKMLNVFYFNVLPQKCQGALLLFLHKQKYSKFCEKWDICAFWISNGMPTEGKGSICLLPGEDRNELIKRALNSVLIWRLTVTCLWAIFSLTVLIVEFFYYRWRNYLRMCDSNRMEKEMTQVNEVLGIIARL